MRAALLFVALLGCGKVGDRPADPDAPDEPVTGPVTVEVLTETGDGLPDLGARVLIVADDADQTVLFEGLVDSTAGTATVTLTGPATVTVRRAPVDRGPQRFVRLVTIAEVRANDHLVVGQPPANAPQTGAQRSRSFTYTPRSLQVSHTFFTPCGNRFIPADGATTSDIAIFDGCAPAAFDFLAIAGNADFIYLPAQDRAATSTINVPPPWTAMSTFTATLVNVPPSQDFVGITRHLMLDGARVTNVGANVPNPEVGGTSTTNLPYPAGVGSGMQLDVAYGTLDTQRRHVLIAATDTVGATFAFDFATMPLPDLLTIPVETTAGATWTEQPAPGGRTESDARMVIWRGQFEDTVAQTQTLIEWQLIDGKRESSITLPSLPADYADVDPARLANFTQLEGAYVYYVACDVLDGYADAKRHNTALFLAGLDLKDRLAANYRCRRTEGPFNN